MMAARRSLPSLLVVGLAMAGLCGASSARAVAQTVTIGAVISSSGPVSSIGIPYVKGIKAAFANGDSFDGVSMKLILIDDGSDPAASSRAARKLIEEDHVDVLMGSAGAPASIAMASVAADLKTPLIITANVPIAGPRGDWEITIPQPAGLMVAADVADMRKAGIKTVGYIGYNDAWGDLVYDALKAQAEPAGIRIVSNERFARTDTSVTPQVLKIMSLHPDAVLTGGSGSVGALPHVALSERGYRGRVYSTHAIINSEFVRIGGNAVNGVIAPTGPIVVAEQLPDSNPIKAMDMKFRADYLKANGEPSTDAFAAYGYDAVVVLADAAKRVLAKNTQPGTPEFREALRAALYETHDVVGTHAVYSFKPGERYGTDERSRVMVTLDKGQWKLIN
jgi:branched-chain amino acid transport system substrate-binding protein